jgi:drug/metabolite transporter (DMT)-like permease
MLWAVFTVLAAAGQTARNAMQRELTATLGTVGATHVRFLFGFPFALIFLLVVFLVTGSLPRPSWSYIPWLLMGALFQVGATATMLAAMGQRSFVVVVAYIKTVIVMSYKPGGMEGGIRPTIIGLISGGMFALSAIGYRGAILDLGNQPNFVMAATFTLACGLVLQAAWLTLYLALRDRAVLTAIAGQWRRSLFAGFMGASASAFWFLAFALASAASVRTLALVEVLFAQAISAFIFGQRTNAREAIGMAMIVIGVIVLIWSHPT